MNKAERIKMVKAMEFIARQIPDEDVLKTWVDYGVEDGDIEYGDLDSVIRVSGSDAVEKYISNDKLAYIMRTFMEVISNAYDNVGGMIGLCCDGVQDYREGMEDYFESFEKDVVRYHTENDAVMGKITGYLIDARKLTFGPVTVDKTEEAISNVLDFPYIESGYRLLGTEKRKYIFYSWGKDPAKWSMYISAFNSNHKSMFYGSLFIVRPDGNGGQESLTDNDIKYIKKNIEVLPDVFIPEPHAMLLDVEHVNE